MSFQGLLLTLLAVAFIIAVAIVILRHTRQGRGHDTKASPYTPYRLAGPLLTATEQEFYRTLNAANYPALICMKVRVADVLAVASGLQPGDSMAAFRRISQKHFDFVFVDPVSFVPVLAIELDDKSHKRSERIFRDALLDNATRVAGLPLIRFAASNRYSVEQIRNRITEAFSSKPS